MRIQKSKSQAHHLHRGKGSPLGKPKFSKSPTMKGINLKYQIKSNPGHTTQREVGGSSLADDLTSVTTMKSPRVRHSFKDQNWNSYLKIKTGHDITQNLKHKAKYIKTDREVALN